MIFGLALPLHTIHIEGKSMRIYGPSRPSRRIFCRFPGLYSFSSNVFQIPFPSYALNKNCSGVRVQENRFRVSSCEVTNARSELRVRQNLFGKTCSVVRVTRLECCSFSEPATVCFLFPTPKQAFLSNSQLETVPFNS